MSMQMYFYLMLEMALFKCSFIVFKSDVGVLTSPGYYMIFTPSVSLVTRVSIFCGMMSHTDIT